MLKMTMMVFAAAINYDPDGGSECNNDHLDDNVVDDKNYDNDNND